MEKNKQEWCEKIFNEIKSNPNNKIVLIGGASSSGKSYSAEMLNKFLTQSGISSKIISADNYYKGIAKTITEKAIINYFYGEDISNKTENLSEIVKKVIENTPFIDKLSATNQDVLNKNLLNVLTKETAQSFVKNLAKEFARINFDEPFAIDFKLLKTDINTLTQNPNAKVIIPSYSFKTGEIQKLECNTIKGLDYQIFIVEGIYVLRNELVDALDLNCTIKTAIDCNLITLLSRKFNRDITNKRIALTPEQTIISYLTNVMPSYYNYILPSLKNAKYTLCTSLTDEEINNKETSNQIKYKLSEESVKLLQKFNFKTLYNKVQTDYYFNDKSSLSSNIVVRIRAVDNLASKLTIKVNTKQNSTINRQIEEYDLKTSLSDSNREINGLLQKFKNSGFVLDKLIEKRRKIFEYKNITFKFDDVKKLNKFIEFDDYKNIQTIDLIKKLKLKNVCKLPYYELIAPLNKKAHLEKEYKFLIDKLPENLSEQYKISQKYIDIYKNQKYYRKLFNINNFQGIETARIRSIAFNNETKYYLTLKSNGLLERNEYETEISKIIFDKLGKKSYSTIQKDRYIYSIDGFKFEFDEFFGKLYPLKTVEVEVSTTDNTNYTKIVNILENVFKLKIKDVTMDERYKNNNLSKGSLENETNKQFK